MEHQNVLAVEFEDSEVVLLIIIEVLVIIKPLIWLMYTLLLISFFHMPNQQPLLRLIIFPLKIVQENLLSQEPFLQFQFL